MCLWLLSPVREPLMFVSLMVELLLMLAPLLMLEPLLVLELPVALVPLLRFIPLVLLAPPALVVLEPLMFEPLMLELRFMLLALSEAGATAPPADAVSVVLALLLLLHAATAAMAAKIAMHFMKSSEGSNYPGSLRDTSARQCSRRLVPSGGNKRTPMPLMREGRNLCGCALLSLM